MDSLLRDATTIAMDFVQASIIQMIRDGELDIEHDRMKFIDEDSVARFLKRSPFYYDKILDYLIQNRLILRILMHESLKESKHHDYLSVDCLIYQEIPRTTRFSDRFFRGR